MTHTSQTSHVHRSRSSSRRSSSGNSIQSSYLQPVFYFSGVVLLLVLVKLLHAGMLSPSIGAFGIILLSVSKQWRFRSGVILSIICMLAMVMVFFWQWIDHYFITLLSAEIISKSAIFAGGLIDSLILLSLMWVYYRLLNSIHMHMSQKWFVKQSYVKVFKLLFHFQLFLFFFWIMAYIAFKAQPFTLLGAQDSTMIAGALALLASGIPAIIYLSKGSPDAAKRHRHRHHLRHDRNGLLKNSNVDEN